MRKCISFPPKCALVHFPSLIWKEIADTTNGLVETLTSPCLHQSNDFKCVGESKQVHTSGVLGHTLSDKDPVPNILAQSQINLIDLTSCILVEIWENFIGKSNILKIPCLSQRKVALLTYCLHLYMGLDIWKCILSLPLPWWNHWSRMIGLVKARGKSSITLLLPNPIMLDQWLHEGREEGRIYFHFQSIQTETCHFLF